MNKIRHDIILRLVKMSSVLLMTGAFGLGWFGYYDHSLAVPYSKNESYLMLAFFMILFVIFGSVYEAFYISMKQVSEMIYSQALAALVTDGVIFIVIWLLTKHFPRVVPIIIVFMVQCVLAIAWSYWSNYWYYKQFPPRATAIVYDKRTGMKKLIAEYGLAKKYDVKWKMTAEECLSQLECLDDLDTVFISGVHSHERNIILKYCMARGIEVLVIPRVGDVLMSSAHPIHMFHLPMLQIRRYDVTPEYLFVKRLMDIVISAVALVVLSPAMLAVAIAIKAYDGGPVFYSQIRLTKDGKTFKILKFRSMRVDAESDGVARLSTGENDDRITPIGKFIRKVRLDELPQLINILNGDLTIVGPRPERPEIAAQYCEEMPEFVLRLQAKAGLTGYAQVYGKYNTTPYDKLQMDLMYIAHPRIIEDLKIMMATVKILFMSESTDGIEDGQTTAAK